MSHLLEIMDLCNSQVTMDVMIGVGPVLHGDRQLASDGRIFFLSPIGGNMRNIHQLFYLSIFRKKSVFLRFTPENEFGDQRSINFFGF